MRFRLLGFIFVWVMILVSLTFAGGIFLTLKMMGPSDSKKKTQ